MDTAFRERRVFLVLIRFADRFLPPSHEVRDSPPCSGRTGTPSTSGHRGCVGTDLLTLVIHVAFIGDISTVDDLHQCGFARAVFSADDMHRSRTRHQVHAVPHRLVDQLALAGCIMESGKCGI